MSNGLLQGAGYLQNIGKCPLCLKDVIIVPYFLKGSKADIIIVFSFLRPSHNIFRQLSIQCTLNTVLTMFQDTSVNSNSIQGDTML